MGNTFFENIVVNAVSGFNGTGILSGKWSLSTAPTNSFDLANKLYVTGASGALQSQFSSIISNLQSSGITLQSNIDSLSGYSNSTFATISNLFATGAKLVNQMYGAGTGISIVNPVLSGPASGTSFINRILTGSDLQFTGGTNAASVVTISGLGVPIGANEIWSINSYIVLSGNSFGYKFNSSGPASPTFVRHTLSGPAGGSSSFDSETITGLSILGTKTYANSTTVVGPLDIRTVIFNGANSGFYYPQLSINVGGSVKTGFCMQGSFQTARQHTLNNN